MDTNVRDRLNTLLARLRDEQLTAEEVAGWNAW